MLKNRIEALESFPRPGAIHTGSHSRTDPNRETRVRDAAGGLPSRPPPAQPRSAPRFSLPEPLPPSLSSQPPPSMSIHGVQRRSAWHSNLRRPLPPATSPGRKRLHLPARPAPPRTNSVPRHNGGTSWAWHNSAWGPVMPHITIARCDGSCSSGKGPARRGDCREQRGGYKKLRAPSMAAPWILFWAVCVLRVVLATVYFQEEFLDGGDQATPWWRGRKLPVPCRPPDARVAFGCGVGCGEASRTALTRVFPPTERWRNRWVQSTNDSQFGHFRLSSGKFYGHKERDKG